MGVPPHTRSPSPLPACHKWHGQLGWYMTDKEGTGSTAADASKTQIREQMGQEKGIRLALWKQQTCHKTSPQKGWLPQFDRLLEVILLY